MQIRLSIRQRILFFITAAIAVGSCDIAWAVEQPPLPKFEKVEAAVWHYFQSQPKYQSSMLITREQVAPLVKVLARAGFTLPDPDSILNGVPARDDFLVAELYSPAGLKFMARIAQYPDAYDRLDRLSRLPHGRQTVHDLIQGPGGDKMIQYMTTVPGGKNMGNMLSNAPMGADFNKPTGRIYTVPMLIVQLKAQYRELEKISAAKK
jgi:hypothetical protein